MARKPTADSLDRLIDSMRPFQGTNPRLPVLNGNRFTWSFIQGTCDASDFGGQVYVGRVWSDSQDVGFWVESPRTGNRVLFTFSGEETDAEGEVLAWTYRSHGSSRELIIKIFND